MAYCFSCCDFGINSMAFYKERYVDKTEVVELHESEKTIDEEVSMSETVAVSEEKEVVNGALNSEYEIVESEDGFFRVRKIGGERTLRKFSNRFEAEDFIEKRGLKHD